MVINTEKFFSVNDHVAAPVLALLSLHTKRKEVQPDEGWLESSAIDGSVNPDSGSAVHLSLVS